MARKIDTDAVINNIRIKEQASKPSTPASGYGRVYGKGNGLYLVDDAGNVGSGLLVTNVQSLTASGTFSAVVGNAYFFDISGLPGDVNFTLPSGEVGDRISVHITTGDDTYELIIKGDTGVSINGGSTATEWSRLFISGESVKLVLTTTSNWQVEHDGRIPCHGRLELSAAETTNGAGTETTPTWDTAAIDDGNICDLTNFRFNIRRAGKYAVSGGARPNSAPGDQQYILTAVYQGATQVHFALARQSGTLTGPSADMPSRSIVCAIGDAIVYKWATQEANKGLLNTAGTFFELREV